MLQRHYRQYGNATAVRLVDLNFEGAAHLGLLSSFLSSTWMDNLNLEPRDV